MIVYAISGLLAGLAGLLVTANFSSATPLAGANDELYAIASVVIGGASIFGGRGTIFGTFIGTAILSVLTTGLVLTNVAPFWQQVAIGGRGHRRGGDRSRAHKSGHGLSLTATLRDRKPNVSIKGECSAN